MNKTKCPKNIDGCYTYGLCDFCWNEEEKKLKMKPCFSCEQRPQVYITGLCEECNSQASFST